MKDIDQFWSQHDAALADHTAGSGSGLSHDLYRGMPSWFNAFFAHFQRRAMKRLLTYCQPLKGLDVLDVGCGTGRWSELFLKLDARPVGVDLGLRALHLAAATHPELHFCAGVLPALCFKDQAFDLAVSVTVVQHIASNRQVEAIADIARVLRPNGRLIVFELVDPDDPASHVFSHSKQTWLELFGAAGLRLVAYAPCEYLPYIKWFQHLRRWSGRRRLSAYTSADVSTVSAFLQQHPTAARLLRFVVMLSYPLEYFASSLLPQRWARLGGFLLEKA